jgi:steroid 5-alpha reductase family enzyme
MKKEKKLITLFFIYIIQGLRLYLKALSVSLDYIKARGEIFTKLPTNN